jgi:release factor glutamine methyltransferase
MKIRDLLNSAIASLKQHNFETPELDARILLEVAANLSVNVIYLKPELELSDDIIEKYQRFLIRRLNHEPVAKIIGKKSFWKDDFIVNEHVLDPRPDSEVIIEAALELFANKNKPYRFLDLGTGSGCLLLSLLKEFPNAIGIGIDISSDALKITQANVESLSLQNRVSLIQQNWGDSLVEKFDLIVSNPPYIPFKDIDNLAQDVKLYDPQLALNGGIDGLDPYRYLAKQLLYLLKKDSYAILEFGQGQGLYIREIFKQHGYQVHKMLIDLSGIERAIIVGINHETRQIHQPC